MSAKHKISQNDLRAFMSVHKKKLVQSSKKIESPLAKYLADGKLKCIVCDHLVASENVWGVHINSKQHRDKINKNKARVPDMPPISLDILKRPAPSKIEYHPPKKKLKSILKNSTTKLVEASSSESSEEEEEVKTEVKTEPVEEPSVSMETESVPDQDLPQGFFDNPLLDAKARNVEYRDPIEEEWERFQKEIKEETSASTKIMLDESESATVERQIVEVNEQLNNWSRVLDLEKKKETLHSITSSAMDIKKEEASSSEEDENLEEFVSWRMKKSFKK